jgi:hypothetical protein
MLYVINKGSTGRPAGGQSTIVHLVSTVANGIALDRAWAISDGNAGARFTTFFTSVEALDGLNWTAIRRRSWQDCKHEKQAEFLVADFFPWTAFHQIGCYDAAVAKQVQSLLSNRAHQPRIRVESSWYY